MAARALRDAAEALSALTRADASAFVTRASSLCGERLRNGTKILACGNGGSACDAMHFCEELSGRFRADRPALAAIACVDVGLITCVANDYGFDYVFARWIEAIGRPQDVVFLLSTSGNSPNMTRAADAAKERGVTRIGLLGRDGGALASRCDDAIVVPGGTSDRIQELHMLLLHAIVEGIESSLGFTRR